MTRSTRGTPVQRFTDRLLAGPNGEWGPRAAFAWGADQGLAGISAPTLLMAFREFMTQTTRGAHRLMPDASTRTCPISTGGNT
ncbi:MAG TPA: hypothetical protein PKH39_18860 [Woeseiaceae bacterium]|nr:hypothetical protein [Woeseiaceae bacterium]